MSGELTIRDARAGERAAIRELTLRAYAEYAKVMDPSAWEVLERAVRAALDAETAAERIVAERDGRIVGSVMLYAPEADAYAGMAAGVVGAPELRLLAVDPAERGRGVGRRLVEECIRRARRAGAAELGLHTSKSMEVAIGMYARLGFVRAPERDFQPEGAELVTGYRLPLHPDPAGGGDPSRPE